MPSPSEELTTSGSLHFIFVGLMENWFEEVVVSVLDDFLNSEMITCSITFQRRKDVFSE